MELTLSAAKKIEHIPHRLHAEFPHVSVSAIERDVNERARRLLAGARFDDYVPLLVHRAIRERLLDLN